MDCHMRRSTILHSDSALSANCAQPRYKTSDIKHITKLVPQYSLLNSIHHDPPFKINASVKLNS